MACTFSKWKANSGFQHAMNKAFSISCCCWLNSKNPRYGIAFRCKKNIRTTKLQREAAVTVVFTPLFSYRCFQTDVLTPLFSHRYFRTDVSTPLFLHCCFHIVVFTASLPNLWFHTAVFTSLFSRCSFHTVVFILLFLHHSFQTVVFTPLFSHRYFPTFVFRPLFSHRHFRTDVSTTMFIDSDRMVQKNKVLSFVNPNRAVLVWIEIWIYPDLHSYWIFKTSLSRNHNHASNPFRDVCWYMRKDK